MSICRPPDQKLKHFLISLTDLLDRYFKYYIYFIMLDDFSEKENNLKMTSFLEQILNNIIKNKKC